MNCDGLIECSERRDGENSKKEGRAWSNIFGGEDEWVFYIYL